MRIVVALGGNALLVRGESPDADAQERRIRVAAAALASLGDGNDLVITHGNGPQVGVLALESETDPSLSHPYPFDVLVAETQGLIGNWLVGAVERAIPAARAVCLLTRTIVEEDDVAFSRPTKFVGPIYSRRHAEVLAARHGWQIRQEGASWRRVVASPDPRGIVEIDEIEALLAHGDIVICAGGGGIPVVADPDGAWRDVEAVVDKDLTAAVLAEDLHADALLLLTDVPSVERDHGTAQARPIRHTDVAELRGLAFPSGSMGPKVEGACRFVDASGAVAAIGRLQDAAALMRGTAGTIVVPASEPGPAQQPRQEPRQQPRQQPRQEPRQERESHQESDRKPESERRLASAAGHTVHEGAER